MIKENEGGYFHGFINTRRVVYAGGLGQTSALTQRYLPKEAKKSPDGFTWGVVGVGSSALALVILLRFLPRREALRFYQQFMFEEIATLGKVGDVVGNFVLPNQSIRNWITLAQGGEIS